jgi:hypothetical protein
MSLRSSILAVCTGMAVMAACPAALRAEPAAVPPAPLPAPRLQVAMPGDSLLDCTGISNEIVYMESVMTNSDEIQRQAENKGTGISIVKAVGGFLVGSVPGALGVMAVGHVAGEAAEGEAEDAAQLENIAALRRSMMVGMYNAKGCKGPIYSQRAIRSAAIETPEPAPMAAVDAAHVEPAAGGRGYKIQAHHVKYND